MVEKQDVSILIYILPPRMYEKMEIKEIYRDARDIIDLFQHGEKNPVHFPGENNVLKVKRICAYHHQ